MKKILFTFIIFFGLILNCRAYSNVYVKYLPLFANQRIDGVLHYAQFGYIYIDGKIAYCVDPGVPIETSTYESTNDYSIANLTPEKKAYLELLAYYGYQYEGHQTLEYYMATQELIWRTVKSEEVFFTTKSQYRGDKINVDDEKNEILRLINDEQKLPSFAGITIHEKVGNYVTLIDGNNVLDSYNIFSENLDLKREHNLLAFKLDKVGTTKISLEQKEYLNSETLLFYAPSSQSLMTFGKHEPLKTDINIEVIADGKKICLLKVDEDSLLPIQMDGAKFGIYKDDKLIETLDLFGKQEQCFFLELKNGSYTLKELESPFGYTKTDKVYPFIIDDDSKEVKFKIPNKKIEMPKTGKYEVAKSSLTLTSFFLGGSILSVFKHFRNN